MRRGYSEKNVNHQTWIVVGAWIMISVSSEPQMDPTNYAFSGDMYSWLNMPKFDVDGIFREYIQFLIIHKPGWTWEFLQKVDQKCHKKWQNLTQCMTLLKRNIFSLKFWPNMTSKRTHLPGSNFCGIDSTIQNKRHVGLIAPSFIIGFLATENLPKVKLDCSVARNRKCIPRSP